jgi:hypothetical protein
MHFLHFHMAHGGGGMVVAAIVVVAAVWFAVGRGSAGKLPSEPK